ncbi:MAG TPA: hypothetical protein VG652_09035 [Gaiellaceae bacterium]|nr:hypothetical protein [Gaiellaceae bacterium]
MRARLLIWALIAATVVLATRVVVYAFAPSELQLAVQFQQQAGGPHLADALVSVSLIAAGLGAALLWLAVVAVRERIALEGRRLTAQPRLPWARLPLRLAALFLITSFCFAMLESYIHWREGLGWHGLHCLIGPVHRDAIPVLAGFSVVAVALHAAVEHLLTWARRALLQLVPRLPRLRQGLPAVAWVVDLHAQTFGSAAAARGPPAFFVFLSTI